MHDPLFPRPILAGAVLLYAVMFLAMLLVACEAGRPTPDIEVKARVFLPAVPLGRGPARVKDAAAPAAYPAASEIPPAPTSAYP